MKKIVLLFLTIGFFASTGFSQENTVYASTYTPCPSQDYFLYYNYTGGLPSRPVWLASSDNFMGGDEWIYVGYADEPLNPKWKIPLHIYGNTIYFKVAYVNEWFNYIFISNSLLVNYTDYSAVVEGPKQVCEPGGSISLTVKGQNFENFSDVLWNTGSTASTITITPVADTTVSVSLNHNGCPISTSHFVSFYPRNQPDKIISTSTGSVCPGGSVTLGIVGYTTVAPCTDAPNGQFPAYALNPCTADGGEIYGRTGEYSLVNVQRGFIYRFFTRPNFDNDYNDTHVTITSADGSQVYGSGGWGEVLWPAPFTGQIRMYSCAFDGSQSSRPVSRFFDCYSDMSMVGTFLWLPGGETTPYLTVSPTTTTNYSLVFTSPISGCPKTLTKQVIVGIGAVGLSTANITCNSAIINWTTVPDPTQWELEYKSTANGSKWINVPVPNAATRSVTVTGLKLNQNYQWHIRAKCGKATTPYSELALFKTLAACAPSLTQSRSMDKMIPENDVEELADELKAVAMPNPSNTNFRVAIGGVNNVKEPVRIIVTDMMGRVVETRTTTAGQVILVGDRYKSGTYLLRLTQGNKTKQLKLAKVLD